MSTLPSFIGLFYLEPVFSRFLSYKLVFVSLVVCLCLSSFPYFPHYFPVFSSPPSAFSRIPLDFSLPLSLIPSFPSFVSLHLFFVRQLHPSSLFVFLFLSILDFFNISNICFQSLVFPSFFCLFCILFVSSYFLFFFVLHFFFLTSLVGPKSGTTLRISGSLMVWGEKKMPK